MEYKMFFYILVWQVAKWPGQEFETYRCILLFFFISTLTNIFHLLAVFLKFFFNRINILLNLLAVL